MEGRRGLSQAESPRIADPRHEFRVGQSRTGDDRRNVNVGFYYMANAGGRLMGTVLSGALYQWYGLTGCLWASVVFVLAAGFLSLMLPSSPPTTANRSKASYAPG